MREDASKRVGQGSQNQPLVTRQTGWVRLNRAVRYSNLEESCLDHNMTLCNQPTRSTSALLHYRKRQETGGGGCGAGSPGPEALQTRLENTMRRLTLVGCIDEDAIKAEQEVVSQSDGDRNHNDVG